MASEQVYLKQIGCLFEHGTMTGLDDSQFLERLVVDRDDNALEALVARHGPMVLGVCQRWLTNPQDADDAFQATFLILIRKARGLRDYHRLGPWLHGVAYRVAARARVDAARRRAVEKAGAMRESDHAARSPDWLASRAELCGIIDEEINHLPTRHRAVLVLCDLEGRTQHDAARLLGWSEGALRGRLARARAKLRDRLVRRGIAPSFVTAEANLLRDSLATSVPAALIESTTRSMMATLLAGRAAPSGVTAISASVSSLAQGVARTMTISKVTTIAAAFTCAAVGLLVLGGLVQAGLYVVADSPPRSAAAKAEPPAAHAGTVQEKAGARTIDLRVISRSDKQPIAGVTVDAHYRVELNWHGTKYRTDDRGSCTIEVPEVGSYVTVTCGKDGFAPAQQRLSDQNGRAALPGTFTQELEPGLPIGGLVNDENGMPVAGAEVTVAISQGKGDQPDLTAAPRRGDECYVPFPHFDVLTDAQGRWRCSILPVNADLGSRLWVFVKHPDYVSEVGRDAQPLSVEAARVMTGTIVMKSGVHVAGEVHDGTGRAVAGATVILAYSGSSDDLLRTTTDAAGRFTFPHANNKSRLGRWSISVEAAGFAPAWKMVVPKGEVPELDFSLVSAKPFRGQVVDNKGRPVAGALVHPRWQECYFLDWKAMTDAAGRFVWPNGPTEGEIEFTVKKDGFMTAFGRRISALAGEVKITINPPVRVRGTVRDAETGQPIPSFRVVLGSALGNQGTSWDRRGRPGKAGQFDIASAVADQPGEASFIRIEADGYVPASSRAIALGEATVDLDFKLKKGIGPSGTVRLPDGSPAVGADVYLTSPSNGLSLENNKHIFQTLGPDGDWLKTDSHGHFAFWPKGEPCGVLVLHPKGVAQKSAAELGQASDLILQPFGRIEGTLRIGSEPGAKQEIRVRLDRTFDAHDHYEFFDYTTRTDDQGRFVIENVMPGEARISRSKLLQAMGHFVLNMAPLVDVDPGQTVNVEIGGKGRPVTGTVLLPPDSATRIDLATASGSLVIEPPKMPLPDGFHAWDVEKRYAYGRQQYLSAAGKARRRAVRRYWFPIGSDRRFRVDDVLPGSYKLTIHVGNAPGFQSAAAGGIRVQGNVKRDVEVKPISGGRSDEPLDLGALVIEMKEHGQRQLAIGETAPQFAIKTLDGRPFRLSEFRGKFVLIDFWATWCSPCLEQELHLTDVHDAFGEDERFAIVGLSLDDKPKIAADHVARRGLKWAQGFLGQASAVADQYGVASIPQIMLVGPDGKIVAKNLGGPGIKAAVSQALARRP